MTDPKLLGGLVVRVGDTVYDGSVATQLSHLRTRLIDRTVEEIETQRERFLSESGSANA
jgi:F-type H+-transporting ATPase subunit delta